MPELTVSMPAFNTGQYIRAAVESVLSQDGIDFELIVVDDGSQDRTSEIVQAFDDPRIRLIRNKKNMGISYCHNLVIKNSNSDFIAHVDSDDLVLPGAFQKVVNKLKMETGISYVHSNYFFIDENGQILQCAALNRRNRYLSTRSVGVDYKRELLVHGGMAINHLRTFRREIFDKVGNYNEELIYGEDFEMGLRIAEKFNIKLVPEFLYCRRIHGSNTTESLQFHRLRLFINRFFICRELSKRGEISFTREGKYNIGRLMLLGLLGHGTSSHDRLRCC